MVEQRQIKMEFSKFKRSELEGTLTKRFQCQVEKYPGRTAIKNSNGKLTYDELNQAANSLACAIASTGHRWSAPISLLFHSDIDMIVALLGVLKIGRYSVPLDPSHPDARNRYILEETQSDLLITNSEGITGAKKLTQGSVRIINIDDVPAISDLPAVSNEAFHDSDISPASLAFILYTSGTTGHPKGTIITHQFLMHIVMYHTNTRRISSEDRISSLTRCHHIGGIADVFRALLNGAALYPFDLRTRTINDLITWLKEERITILHCVPTVFRILVNLLPKRETLPYIRLVLLGGEPVTKRDVELYRTHFSNNCILVNNLGSSETGPLGQYFLNKETQVSSNIVPVNLEVEDKNIFLINQSNKPTQDGDIGEIAVRSKYISPGYWSKYNQDNIKRLVNEGDTIKTFSTGDLGRIGPDGMFVYIGRKDHQVNIHGYRVDVTEVEANIRNLGMCEDVAVAVHQSDQGESRLIAYVVSANNRTSFLSALRSKLVEFIPTYMVPSDFIYLESLPRTPAGKVDRRALPYEDMHQIKETANHVAPRGEIEKELVCMYKELMQAESVSIKDNVFDLGGDSLFVIRLSIRLKERWGAELSITDIYNHPTVEEIAALIL